jgi:hypothetical protein
MKRIGWFWSLILLAGLSCTRASDPEPYVDGGLSEVQVDSGHVDSGHVDSGRAQDDGSDEDFRGDIDLSVDAARAEMGVEPAAGFGLLSGQCGGVSAELSEDESSLFENVIDFQNDPFDDGDLSALSPGGAEILTDGNAGGGSLLSEVFSFEVLHRCDGAQLLKSENEIVYDNPMGKRTDLLVMIDGQRVGVSVTRAVGFPRDAPYTPEEATVLIEKKLEGVQASTQNVAATDRWIKQVLHILAFSEEHAQAIRAAYGASDESLRRDTIVVVTQTDGADAFLYE